MKKALVTGITGQDGSYLAEFLLEKGYEVHGMVRRASSPNTSRIHHLLTHNKFKLYEGDLSDGNSIRRIINNIKPDEIYNLAGMSDVGTSFYMPEYTADVNGTSIFRFLEVMREVCPKARFYQASTSELYGKVCEIPQSETTPFQPRSPYAISKLSGYWAVVNYRDAYNLYACNGILFNHESPRRGELFVSRKITLAVNQIVQGKRAVLTLGNLNAERDWGYAPDFIEGIYLVLQQEKPDDYVLATGKTHSVRRFVELAFLVVGIQIEWEGKGCDEVGRDRKTGQILVNVSPEFYRPSEVDFLLGNPAKAKSKLGWTHKTSFEELVQIMMEADASKECMKV